MLKNILTVLRKLASAAMNFLIVYFVECYLTLLDCCMIMRIIKDT